MSRASETCPVCNDRRTVRMPLNPGSLTPYEDKPCPRCRPAAPGRLLKALPGESKGAAELAVDMTEDTTR